MTSESARKSVPSIEDLANFYTKSAFDFGAADIFCCGPFDTAQRVADLLFILSMVKDANGRTPIARFTIVLPLAGEIADADIPAAFKAAVLQHRGSPLDARELEILGRRLKVVRSPNLQIASATTLIEKAEPHSVMILCDAGRYRDSVLTASKPGDALRLEEDIWVLHCVRLAELAVTAAKQADCYAALDVCQFRPYRQENVDLLKSIADCGVLSAETDDHPDSFVATHGEKWFADLRAGRIGSVLAAIDSLPVSIDRHKIFLKIQILHRAGLLAQAVELIRSELAAKRNINPESAVKLAAVAVEAGEGRLASELLTAAAMGLDSREWLELALALSSELRETALEERYSSRLDARFPDSHSVHRYRLQKLLRRCDYGAMQVMLADHPACIPRDMVAFYTWLAVTLATQTKPDYDAMLNEVADQWPDFVARAKLACARDADARGLFDHALAIAQSADLTGRSCGHSGFRCKRRASGPRRSWMKPSPLALS